MSARGCLEAVHGKAPERWHGFERSEAGGERRPDTAMGFGDIENAYTRAYHYRMHVSMELRRN